MRCLAVLLPSLLLPFALAAQQPAPEPAAPVAPAKVAPPPVLLSGRLLTADGSPVVGAALRFAPVVGVPTVDVLQKPDAISGADGRFELRAQPPRLDGVGAEVVPKDDERPAVLWVAAKGFASLAIDVPWKRRRESSQLPSYLLGEGAAAGIAYAERTELDDVVLVPGHRLLSRVRDAAGKPLAGVRVQASDLLADSNLFQGDGDSARFLCVATSDANGIVDLPCVLPNAASLTFLADGFHVQRLAPVSAATPVEVAMQKGGWIQGRVLDKEGHGIGGAYVSIGYERQNGMPGAQLRTDPDGAFRTNLDHPGRWRVSAWRHREDQSLQGHSPVWSGARENIELLVEGETAQKAVQIPVRVVAKGSGKPVPAFRVAAVWHEYANQNPGYREYLLCNQLQHGKPGAAGAATVRAPGQHEVASGWLRTLAPGFAPATQQVEWKEPAAGQAPEALVVELEPEAVVRGVLRDEASGQPVAGAQVIARVRQDPSAGFYGNEFGVVLAVATSAADGSYELRGLGAGAWNLRALAAGRPRSPVVEVELAAAEQKAGVDMLLPTGAVVGGKLVGAVAGTAMRVLLARVPQQAFGGVASFGHYGSEDETPPLVPVAADGTFRCEGVGLDNWQLVLRVPSPPRLGGDLFLPIEPFRVRPAGVQREFDCSLDRPGTIRGRVTFAATDVPLDQLVVVARGVGAEGQDGFSPFDGQLVGPRSFVSPTGEYELRVGPGSYRPVVVDLGTMLVVHDETKRIDVKSGATAKLDIVLELARVELELKGPADGKPMADVERVEVRVVSAAQKAAGVQVDASDDYDRGIGIRWPVGQTVLSVVLPLGDATFACRNTLHAIRIDDNRWNNPPLGRAEFEIARGPAAKTRCVIEVGTPPEVVDPEKKPGAEADDAAVQEIRIK